MGFLYKKNGNANGERILRKHIIGNSKTVVVGDAVLLTSGFIALATAGARLYGIVAAITENFQSDLGPDSNGAGGVFRDTFTTASDNQTVAQVSALVDVSPDSIYSAELSAAAGTTTGSNLAGYYMDLTDEDTLDEATAATTAAQFFSYGLDPANTARVLVSIAESLLHR